MNLRAMWAQELMSATSRSSEPARRCILVVDDDEVMREAVGLLLEPTYQLRYAVDGIDGYEKANELPRPDLIIADVTMPRLDGIAMVQRIRANAALHRVPVIFFTGQTSVASIIAGLSVGTFAYLSKTAAPGVLEGKVRRALGG
jgi:PleD family two-component response regulator